VFGLTKKVLIADRLAMFVDGAFDNAGAMDGFTTWLAVLCYAVQIYCDFSGYSDMAIGVACMLGYDFCENFRHPYIATNITDFWRRWHISLSTWLRDYLYIPLGGNRKGATRTYINLFLTMLLGGLWHGAAWTFVVWGAIHGSALAAHKYLAPRLKIDPRRRFLNAAMRFAGWATTMLIVVVAWVPFRAADFNQARLMLRQMFYHFDGIAWYSPFAIAALAVMIVAHGIHRTQLARLVQLPAGKWYTPVVLFLLTWLVFSFQPREFQPFIYFQF
jgi:alginate O-acetyltransferase complex protein AlgI